MRVTEIYYPFTHESLRLAYYSHHRVLVWTDTVPKPKLEQEAGVWTRRGEVDFLLWQTARDPSLREWLDAPEATPKNWTSKATNFFCTTCRPRRHPVTKDLDF